MTISVVPHSSVFEAALAVAERIYSNHPKLVLRAVSPTKAINLFGVPGGGVPAAYAVLHYVHQPHKNRYARIVGDVADADIIIEDIVQSGRTQERYLERFPDKHFYSLFLHTGDWLCFPWEGSDPLGSWEDIPRRLIQFIGDDPDREGLKRTPERVLEAWSHWTKGYQEDPEEIVTLFDEEGRVYDEMIFQGAIPIWSTCEHHLSPFFGLAHVAYIPRDKIVGLSKLARLVDVFARRLQLQERLTEQVAECINSHLKPIGVGVVLQCRHTCMESRGIEKMGTITSTSALRGAIKNEPDARAEFLAFVHQTRPGNFI